MLVRNYPDILSAYTGITDELAYGVRTDRVLGGNWSHQAIANDDDLGHGTLPAAPYMKWGVCIGYVEPVCINIEDVLKDDSLHLDMASYTKSRWTRFLRRYLREDFPSWIDENITKLERYPRRPFVASYSVNHSTGHNYGGCLSSLQFRICPEPTVILYSRACHMDKVGFLDLAFMHMVAQAMNYEKVKAEWVISNCFVSAISQIFYIKRFNKDLLTNRLGGSMKRLIDVDYDAIKFGPLKRGRKRMADLDKFGHIPRSVPVSDLKLEARIWQK